MQEEIIALLTIELRNDDNFDADLLSVKVKSAYREIAHKRNYPISYTKELIERDMLRYFSNVKNLALYDYNQYGAEFEKSHDENGIGRSYVEREKLFSGVVPIARF